AHGGDSWNGLPLEKRNGASVWVRSKDEQVEFGEEEGDLEAVAGRSISVRVRNAMYETFEAKTPKVIGHLHGGIGTSPEGFYLRTEIAMAKAARQMGKADQGLQQGHDAGIAEAEGGHALPVHDRGLLEAIERVLGEHAVVTEALHFKQLAIDLLAEIAQMREVVEPLSDPEIPGVIDGHFGSYG